MKTRLVMLLVTLAAVVPAAWAAAEPMESRSWGGRIGYRLGEDEFDQLVVGVHGDVGDFQKNVRFAPNATMGFGSNATVVSLNPDVHYVFRDDPLEESALFYLGGGLGVHFIDFHEHDSSEVLEAGPDETETHLKVHLVSGIEARATEKLGYFGEMRISFVDGTWIELLGGINFLR